MLDDRVPSPRYHHPHRIETIEESRPSMTPLPHARYALDLTPLESGDGLQRVSISVSGARFDLDERDNVAETNDQIDFTVAKTVVPLENRVTQPFEIA